MGFELGQIWLTRRGTKAELILDTGVPEEKYPLKWKQLGKGEGEMESIFWTTIEGKFWDYPRDATKHDLDIISLITGEKSDMYEVGKMYEMRNGKCAICTVNNHGTLMFRPEEESNAYFYYENGNCAGGLHEKDIVGAWEEELDLSDAPDPVPAEETLDDSPDPVPAVNPFWVFTSQIEVWLYLSKGNHIKSKSGMIYGLLNGSLHVFTAEGKEDFSSSVSFENYKDYLPYVFPLWTDKLKDGGILCKVKGSENESWYISNIVDVDEYDSGYVSDMGEVWSFAEPLLFEELIKHCAERR